MLRFCALWTGTLLLAIPAAQAAVSIAVFCDAPQARACSDVMPPQLDALRAQIKDHVDAAYRGKIIDPLSDDPARLYYPGVTLETPICDRAPPPSARFGAELATNHLGETCGAPCGFSCSYDPLRAQYNCTQQGAPASCGLEKAWLRGEMIRQVWLKLDEIVAELDAPGHRLMAGDRCSAPVPGFELITVKLAAVQARWNAYWMRAGTPPPLCDNDEAGVASCFLESARKAMESVPIVLSICETLARAESEWLLTGALYENNVHYSLGASLAACENPPPPVFVPAPPSCFNPAYVSAINPIFSTLPPFSRPPNIRTMTPDPLLSCNNPEPGWEAILCNTPPVPSPFAIAQLTAMVRARELLDQAEANALKADQFLSQNPVVDR